MKSILINAEPVLRESLTGLGTRTRITQCADLHDTTAAPSATTYTLTALARRIRHLAAEMPNSSPGSPN